jgi:hypothetical protein
MAYEQRDNSGSFFINNRKSNASQPDFNGSVIVDGKDYYISIWSKEGKTGEFWSCAFTPKNKSGDQRATAPQKTSSLSKKPMAKAPLKDEDLDNEIDDEIPF